MSNVIPFKKDNTEEYEKKITDAETMAYMGYQTAYDMAQNAITFINDLGYDVSYKDASENIKNIQKELFDIMLKSKQLERVKIKHIDDKGNLIFDIVDSEE